MGDPGLALAGRGPDRAGQHRKAAFARFAFRRTQDCQRSRNLSAKASTSTSHCCSRSSATSRSSTPTSGDSRPAQRPAHGWTRSAPWASFFLSRIDTKVDQRLPDGSPLPGQVALASARVAYQRYLAKFAAPEWERLENLGAKRQRPLWASTGTKNPHYSDVLYVSELIGPDVVNTMPEHTLRTFADHGEVKPTLTADPDGAQRTRAEAETAGIDLGSVTAELEREGVQSFCDSYNQLLNCIETKLGARSPARMPFLPLAV